MTRYAVRYLNRYGLPETTVAQQTFENEDDARANFTENHPGLEITKVDQLTEDFDPWHD